MEGRRLDVRFSLAWADGGVVEGWERGRVRGEDDEGRKVR